MAFTKNQERAISLRDKNILVSAAAGSGKTSVLTERIFRRITDEQAPVDIDRMLIMTFTNPAAKEMRDRIREKIERAIDSDPGNENLMRQSVLVHNAMITTIHGFCQSIIRDHFEKIDIDPNFRVGDENECKLLRLDVLDSILEEKYDEASERFLDTVESFSETKGDKNFAQILMRFYLFSQSSPMPDEFFDMCIKPYSYESVEEFANAPFLNDFVRLNLNKVSELVNLAVKSIKIIDDVPALLGYKDRINDELDSFLELSKVTNYSDFRSKVLSISFGTLSGVSAKSLDEDEVKSQKQVQSLRNTYKAEVTKLKEIYRDDVEILYRNMSSCKDNVIEIIELTRLFASRYSDKKKEKNIIDFNDMEHMAIKILRENPEIAQSIREHYVEIYVDEYQDSNLTQEVLLDLIRVHGDTGNLFMVGDVKQSIYRFRQARPDLFIDKYNSFTDGEEVDTRVILNDNFRSRDTVIDAVNEVFYKIMTKDIGGIVYDEDAALKFGSKSYKDVSDLSEDKDFYKAELIVGVGEDVSKIELEANIVASRIRKMISDKMPVYDKEKDVTRPIEYRDIVILVRSIKGMSESIKTVLMDANIPVAVTSREGYFDTKEIRTALAFLSVIDNPLQDIPLATIMRSQVFGFTNRELALLRVNNGKEYLYDSVRNYIDVGEDASLQHKCESLLDKVSYYREISSYTPVYSLLESFVDKEYGDYVRCMDKGAQRMANLNMLMNKARDYSKTSFTGLFNFVRYIELIKKYEIEEGEANVLGEQDNVVRIMTIHKSKGLEFPVCFLLGIEKNRNQMDERQNVVWDPSLGLGIDYTNVQSRIKYETIYKSLIKKNIALENLAEEIRVLYVALTRAREKLIMVAASDKEDIFDTKKVSISSCQSYLDLLVYANNAIIDSGEGDGFRTINVSFVSSEDIVFERVEEELHIDLVRDELLDVIRNRDESYEDISSDEKFELMTYEYPFEVNDNMPLKLSVSELKHQAIEEMRASGEELVSDGQKLFAETQPDKYIPKFMRKEGESVTGGTFYGTAFHRILELWEYDNKEVTSEAVLEFASRMYDGHQMDREQVDAIRGEDIAFFLNSDTGRRMYAAKQNGRLYREQPFVIGVLRDDAIDENDYLLVQGIIDAFIEEDDGIMILDYKTDRVSDEQILINRYRTQLEYYKKALSQITGKSVKELIIYSSCLRKSIML